MEKIQGVLSNVTKGDSLKDDFAMANKEFANATNHLASAPLCISTMAQICLVATNRDFSIDDGRKFEVLTSPESFRASLYQLSANVVNAFKQSHHAMDVVTRETNNVKGHLGLAMRILFQGTPVDLEDQFPTVLTRIERIATTCEEESQAVVEKFEHVIKIINEISEAAYVKKGKTEEAKDDAERNAEIAKLNKIFWEEQKKTVKAQLDKYEENEKELSKLLQEALDDVPSGWEMIGMKFVSGLAETVTNLSTLLNPADIG